MPRRKPATAKQVEQAAVNIEAANVPAELQPKPEKAESSEAIAKSIADLIMSDWLNYIQYEGRVHEGTLCLQVLNTVITPEFKQAIDLLIQREILVVADRTPEGRFVKLKPYTKPNNDIIGKLGLEFLQPALTRPGKEVAA